MALSPLRLRAAALAALTSLVAAPAAAQPAAQPAADSASAPCLPADSARGAVRYTVVTAATRPSGCLLVWREGPGSPRAFYTYNDRGRGPRLASRYVFDAYGNLTRLDVTGTDYLKVAVAESYELAPGARGRMARWRSTAERDSAVVTGTIPHYLGMNGPPIEEEHLARAALRAGAAGLPLLPSGRAHAERVRDTVLTDSAGHRQRVTLVAVRGVGFTPGAVWLDDGGGLFASGSAWSMTIRSGFEGAVNALDAIQRAWSAARQRDLARRLAHRPAGGALVVRGARLFAPETLETRDGMTVVVRGERVERVAPDGAVPASALPAGATVIDARGRTLLPGLWDMHVHADAGSGIYHLAAGVTTVRDMGNDWTLPETGRRWARGDALGPRLLMSGFMDGAGPFTGPTGTVIRTLAEGLAAIDRYADSGYVQLKLYSSIDTAFVAPLVERAHARGLRVSGHVPNGMTAERFVRAGADELQHANFVVLNFLADSAGDTRTPARFTVPARLAATLDLRSEPVRRFVELLRARGTTVDPTLNVWEEMFTGRPGVLPAAWAPVVDRMPPQVQRGLRAGGGGLPVPETPAGMDARYRASYDSMATLVRLLHEAGVPIVAGTDAAPGWALHRELELYVQAGIPAPAVLRIATLGAARTMKRDAELGSVREGKLADFVLVDGDPLARISDVRRTWLVVKGGVTYRPDELYAELGMRPARATP